ncbi:MAG: DnaA regulatory inactivator Hda [Betaproteobacteria bacterium]|nr:DnaA regulatory inactivator Hda [Betaproteobacteria bacterium]
MMRQLLLSLAPPPAPTLGNFYCGPNAAALAAIDQALSGGERFVCLWGDAGSGKTHLLRAFVLEARSRGLVSRYIPAPHVGLAAAHAEEALAVDDVEALDEEGQLALFDLYNAVRSDRGRLLAAASRPPAELSLREDLRSRLGSGIVLRVLALEDAEKSAALNRYAAQRGLKLAPEIASYLLTHCSRDMGTQVAVLDALDRYSLEHKRPITLPLMREALQSLDLLGRRLG